jgi:hypothetical protein
MSIHVEEIDLAALARSLAERRPDLSGWLEGRTALRDEVALRLGASALEAEELVDTLVARGLVVFVADEGAPRGGGWVLLDEPVPYDRAA